MYVTITKYPYLMLDCERRAEMERLTIPDKKIDGGVRRAFIDVKAVKENAMTIYWALKRYEDTGLAPPEIMELKEKNTPKEAIYEGDGYADGEMVYDTWICPNCGAKYEVDYDDYDFCPDCGQMILR